MLQVVGSRSPTAKSMVLKVACGKGCHQEAQRNDLFCCVICSVYRGLSFHYNLYFLGFLVSHCCMFYALALVFLFHQLPLKSWIFSVCQEVPSLGIHLSLFLSISMFLSDHKLCVFKAFLKKVVAGVAANQHALVFLLWCFRQKPEDTFISQEGFPLTRIILSSTSGMMVLGSSSPGL